MIVGLGDQQTLAVVGPAEAMVIKPGPGVDLAKGPDPRFHGSTRKN